MSSIVRRAQDTAMQGVFIHPNGCSHVGGKLALTESLTFGLNHAVQNTGASFQSVIDELPIAVAILDEEARIIAVNRAYAPPASGTGGKRADRLIGKPYLSVYWSEAAEAGLVQEGLRELLAGRRQHFGFAYQTASAGGDPRHFRLRASRFTLSGKTRLMVVCEDVTMRKRIKAEREAFAARLLHAQHLERQRIARELHDSTAQHLVAIGLSLARLGHLEPDPIAADALSDIREALASAHEEIRVLTYLLHPPSLEGGPLLPAIRRFSAGFSSRTGLQITLPERFECRNLSPGIKTALFRVVQEALANVYKHASAEHISIRLSNRRECIRLEVEDDGKGFPAEDSAAGDSPYGVGIASMSARLREIGGRLTIARSRNGTLVTAILPSRALEM